MPLEFLAQAGAAPIPEPDKMAIIRIALAVTSLAVFLVTFHLIRKERLKEGYSIVWLVAAMAILAFAIWPRWAFAIQHKTNISYLSVMLGLSLLLLIVIVLHFVTVISRLDNENKRLAQHLAVLNHRLEQMEQAHQETEEGR
jgi:hypothetical protein